MKKFVFLMMVFGLGFFFVGCSDRLAIPENVNVYTMNLEYDSENKTIAGDLSVLYVNQSDTTQNQVKFHLYPNAFRENSKATVVSLANTQKAYPNGKSYGNISINNVLVADKQCEVLVGGEDENILTIPLEKELYPNEKIEIDIKFETRLANINHRLGYGENCVNLCNFYPVACVYENGDFVTDLYNANGDPFYSKIASYFVTFTYDQGFMLASSGKQTIEKNGSKNVAKIEAKGVRDFAMVLSQKFSVICDNVEETEIEYYYIKDKTPENSMKIAKQSVEFFEEKFGQYPYSKLSVVETSFVHGGMEYPNIVLISDEISDYETYQMVIVHEIAHQWWYGVVGNNQYSHGWLDEGLTEYSTALFYDAHPEYNKTSAQIVRNATASYATFAKVYSDVLGEVDTSMNRELDEFATEPEYVYNTYTKGMLMFATIKELVGEKCFFECLSFYYNNCAFKEVKPEDMIACFMKASGKNLESVFLSWIDGKVVIMMPE